MVCAVLEGGMGGQGLVMSVYVVSLDTVCRWQVY